MYQINCNSIDIDGNCVTVSFSFQNGLPEEGIEITVGDDHAGSLYFEIDELALIIETLKKEAERRKVGK